MYYCLTRFVLRGHHNFPPCCRRRTYPAIIFITKITVTKITLTHGDHLHHMICENHCHDYFRAMNLSMSTTWSVDMETTVSLLCQLGRTWNFVRWLCSLWCQRTMFVVLFLLLTHFNVNPKKYALLDPNPTQPQPLASFFTFNNLFYASLPPRSFCYTHTHTTLT